MVGHDFLFSWGVYPCVLESGMRQVRKGQIPPLHVVEDFMLSLTNANDGMTSVVFPLMLDSSPVLDGRVTFTLTGPRGQEEVEIKYQLLNPAPDFFDVVDEARSVVLAGGTMSPVSMLDSRLSPILTLDLRCLM